MPLHPSVNTDNLLVLGAGELGMALLRQLALQPAARVTVMLRDVHDTGSAARRQTLDELNALGIDTVAGDAARDGEARLAELFSRFDTVVSCLGFAAGAGIQLKLARAAVRSSVKRYVPWQFGVDYDVIGRGSPQNLFDEQLDVRDVLRGQSRVHWLIISTGMFTSFLFEPAFGVVDLEHHVIRALGEWDNAVTLTTPEDIGRLTAAILFDPALVDQVVFTAGDTITYRQLADTVDHSLGRRLERVQWTVPALKAELANAPDDSMRKYRAVFAEGRGVAWAKADTYNARKHIDTTTLAQWVARHLH